MYSTQSSAAGSWHETTAKFHDVDQQDWVCCRRTSYLFFAGGYGVQHTVRLVVLYERTERTTVGENGKVVCPPLFGMSDQSDVIDKDLLEQRKKYQREVLAATITPPIFRRYM